ncbi:hypothetical protein CDL15_Pgr012045 [Punica granatum]|uniref:Uncharacterized protein n=1 Tax=Punica granatum TaxID=22663 RepID=A0A218XKM8_PUNGR|nr:hypothetical protein CDL15_Pgr012045 [Punica granatum]
MMLSMMKVMVSDGGDTLSGKRAGDDEDEAKIEEDGDGDKGYNGNGRKLRKERLRRAEESGEERDEDER